jgi:hypothetical protein
LDRGGRPPKQNIRIIQNHRMVVSGECYLDLGSYRCRSSDDVGEFQYMG